MPFDRSLTQSPVFQNDLAAFFKRTPCPRPAGAPRALHLSMSKALTRGPTPDEVKQFGTRAVQRRAAAQQDAEAGE